MCNIQSKEGRTVVKIAVMLTDKVLGVKYMYVCMYIYIYTHILVHRKSPRPILLPYDCHMRLYV